MGMSASVSRMLATLLVVLVVVHITLLPPEIWGRNHKHLRNAAFRGMRHLFESSHTGDGGEVASLAASKQEATQKSLKRHIKKSCQKLGLETKLTNLSSHMLYHSKILVNDKHKLLYCQVAKVASTTWRRIFIVLSDKINVTNLMNISANDAHHKYNEHLTYLRDLPPDQMAYRLQNYFKFIFVREPFGRLLSAFRNKFEGNTNSSRYFKRSFGRKIIKRYRRYTSTEENSPDVKFEEYIRYLIDAKRRIPMNEHWETFTDLCHPCIISYDFIGKLETFSDDANYILQKNSLSEIVKIPSRKESRYENYETTSLLTKYFSVLPLQTLKKLQKTYLSDFIIFKYPVPEVIKTSVY